MGSVRVACPMCGLKVGSNGYPGFLMERHPGWDGEECLGSGRSPSSVMDELRSYSQEQRRYGVEGV